MQASSPENKTRGSLSFFRAETSCFSLTGPTRSSASRSAHGRAVGLRLWLVPAEELTFLHEKIARGRRVPSILLVCLGGSREPPKNPLYRPYSCGGFVDRSKNSAQAVIRML